MTTFLLVVGLAGPVWALRDHLSAPFADQPTTVLSAPDTTPS
ncbi:hypothetical protein ACT1U9_14395 [Streptomyces sp. BR1]